MFRKQIFHAIGLSLLMTACSVSEKITTTSSQSNDEITADFYQQLIKSDIPNRAMLNLFFTNMPKGGDLHNHYTGTIYAETYLDWVKTKDWRIDSCTLIILIPEDGDVPAEGCAALTVDQVVEDGDLYGKLMGLWSDKDFYNHYHEQIAPDQNFFNTFTYFGKVSDQYMADGLNILKERAVAENVNYIETMLSSVGIVAETFFTDPEALNERLKAATTQAEVDVILDEISTSYLANTTFNNEVQAFVDIVHTVHQGIDDEQFTMRFQTYGVRVLDPLQVFTDLFSGYLTADGSALIVGVNIVAPENNQVALDDYTLHMQMYNYLLRKYPTVHRALHAGELNIGMVRPKDLLFHIDQALDIAQAQRIGHGVDIAFEEGSIDLLSKLRQSAVIEINLTSNEFILGVEGKDHPYMIYSSYGVPMVISTDDSGVSRNNLSNEYMLLATRYRPSYDLIKEYVYNSIRYSFLEDDDKKTQMDLLDIRFKEFEEKIVQLTKDSEPNNEKKEIVKIN